MNEQFNYFLEALKDYMNDDMINLIKFTHIQLLSESIDDQTDVDEYFTSKNLPKNNKIEVVKNINGRGRVGLRTPGQMVKAKTLSYDPMDPMRGSNSYSVSG